jgi:hypothetical protein
VGVRRRVSIHGNCVQRICCSGGGARTELRAHAHCTRDPHGQPFLYSSWPRPSTLLYARVGAAVEGCLLARPCARAFFGGGAQARTRAHAPACTHARARAAAGALAGHGPLGRACVGGFCARVGARVCARACARVCARLSLC